MKLTKYLLIFIAPALAAQDLSVDEVVARNFEAKGAAAWRQVQSARIEGRMTMGPNADAPYTIEFKRPQKLRMEFALGDETGTQIFDGERGWVIMPFLGAEEPQPMTREQLRDIADMADFDGPLVDWKEKGHQLEYLGYSEQSDGPVHGLRLVRSNGDVSTIHLDAETFLEKRQVVQSDRQGQAVTVTTTLGDYREVGELVVAHSMTVRVDGLPYAQELSIEQFIPNADVADERFTPPQ